MKSIFKYAALVAGLALLCVSCKNKLTIPPVGSLSSEGYFNDPAHVEEGIRGTYSKLRGIENGAYATMSELRSDNVWMDPAPNGTREPSEIGHYRFTPSTGVVGSLWANWYSVIYNANNVLESMDKVTFTNEDVKKQFKGELLFLRAYAHFEMTRVFGNVPIVDHVLSSSESNTLKQTSAKDVLNTLVVPDLKEAIDLLPYQKSMRNSSNGSASNEFRADKLAAQGMLARVLMTLYGWPYKEESVRPAAKSLLKEVIDFAKGNGYWTDSEVEWKKMFTTDRATQNKLFIFAIQHTNSTGNTFAYNSCGESLSTEYFPTFTSGSTLNGNNMTPAYVEATIRHEYEVTGDKRGEFCILDTMNPIGLYQGYPNRKTDFTLDNGERVSIYERSLCTKWLPYATKRESVGVQFNDGDLSGGWPVNFPIIRTEDMMLLYAELLAGDGDAAAAVEIVNSIRKRAGVELRPTSCSAAEALEFVKKERKLEFFGEGIRWFDEIRYGEWKEATVKMFNRYINSSYAGYASTVAPGNVVDGKYLCPIPETEMKTVPGLYVQNDGWK